MRLGLLLVVVATSGWARDGGTSEGFTPGDLAFGSLTRQRATLVRFSTALGESPTPGGCDTQRVYRAVYAPSFAVPLVVTLRVGSAADGGTSAGTLELAAPSAIAPDGGVTIARHSATLTPAQVADVTARLEKLAPRSLKDLPSEVLDGMGVRGTVCGPREPPADFIAWSPDAGPHRKYFRALVDLARATYTDEAPLFAAETAVTYLSEPGELVYADSGGNPRTLRLTGVSSSEATPFRALVAGVVPTADLIIDLRNFSGAGTMFKPEFLALDRRKGRTTWVIAQQGMDYLARSFGVDRTHMVDSMDAARKRLK